jgi:hypothetical protein
MPRAIRRWLRGAHAAVRPWFAARALEENVHTIDDSIQYGTIIGMTGGPVGMLIGGGTKTMAISAVRRGRAARGRLLKLDTVTYRDDGRPRGEPAQQAPCFLKGGSRARRCRGRALCFRIVSSLMHRARSTHATSRRGRSGYAKGVAAGGLEAQVEGLAAQSVTLRWRAPRQWAPAHRSLLPLWLIPRHPCCTGLDGTRPRDRDADPRWGATTARVARETAPPPCARRGAAAHLVMRRW